MDQHCQGLRKAHKGRSLTPSSRLVTQYARIQFKIKPEPEMEDGLLVYGYVRCSTLQENIVLAGPLPIFEPITEEAKEKYAKRISDFMEKNGTTLGPISVLQGPTPIAPPGITSGAPDRTLN